MLALQPVRDFESMTHPARGPVKVIRSFSKISTASNFAAAMASSFSPNVPLNDTVAIDVFT
jgi:hypothetical protein